MVKNLPHHVTAAAIGRVGRYRHRHRRRIAVATPTMDAPRARRRGPQMRDPLARADAHVEGLAGAAPAGARQWVVEVRAADARDADGARAAAALARRDGLVHVGALGAAFPRHHVFEPAEDHRASARDVRAPRSARAIEAMMRAAPEYAAIARQARRERVRRTVTPPTERAPTEDLYAAYRAYNDPLWAESWQVVRCLSLDTRCLKSRVTNDCATEPLA